MAYITIRFLAMKMHEWYLCNEIYFSVGIKQVIALCDSPTEGRVSQ